MPLCNLPSYRVQDPKGRIGMFQHPIITDIINTVWFASRGEDPLFPNIFNPNTVASHPKSSLWFLPRANS